jgi:hypothetical protein
LEHGDQGQPPGREGGLPPVGVEVGKVGVANDRPELIADVLGDRRDGAGLQGPGDSSGRLAASCKA